MYPQGLTGAGWAISNGLSKNPGLVLDVVDLLPNVFEFWNWNDLSMNPNLTYSFLESHSDRLNVDLLCKNPAFPHEWIIKHANNFTQSQWNDISIHNKLTIEFMKACERYLNWYQVWSNPHLPDEALSTFGSRILTVAINVIGNHKGFKEEMIIQNIDTMNTSLICSNPNITEDFIHLITHRMAYRDWAVLSKNPNIPPSIIEEFKDKLNWFHLSFHLGSDLTKRFEHMWDDEHPENLHCDVHFNDGMLHKYSTHMYDRKIRNYLSSSKYLDIHIAKQFKKHLNLELVCKNPEATPEILDVTGCHWTSLSASPLLSKYPELLTKYEDKLDWDLVSSNEHIYYQFIIDNPQFNWNPLYLSQRRYFRPDGQVEVKLDLILQAMRVKTRELSLHFASSKPQPKISNWSEPVNVVPPTRNYISPSAPRYVTKNSIHDRVANNVPATRSKVVISKPVPKKVLIQSPSKISGSIVIEKPKSSTIIITEGKGDERRDRVKRLEAERMIKEEFNEKIKKYLQELDSIGKSYEQALINETQLKSKYETEYESLHNQITQVQEELNITNSKMKKAKRSNDVKLIRSINIETSTIKYRMATLEVRLCELELAEAKRLSVVSNSEELRESLHKIKLEMDPQMSTTEYDAQTAFTKERLEHYSYQCEQLKLQLENNRIRASQLQLELHQISAPMVEEVKEEVEVTKRCKRVKRRHH
jgi:hypothetical protein